MCNACVFANDECTWCREFKKPIHRAMYGCVKHMTDTQALQKIAEEQVERHRRDMSRLMLKMDIMAYLINGASLVLEEVDNELDQSYQAVKHKTDDETRNHAESKRNRDRLAKAYKSMSFSMQDIRNTFNRYVEYYFNVLYSDGKTYDFKESDKNLVNSGVIASFTKALVDRTLDNGENAESIWNHIISLPGSGILDERDLGKSMIRK